jgi:hypothetical protein
MFCRSQKNVQHFFIVTDGEAGECMDPAGNGAILNVGEGREPGPPREEENGQLASDSGGG